MDNKIGTTTGFVKNLATSSANVGSVSTIVAFDNPSSCNNSVLFWTIPSA